jgi:hypothetical protein
MPGRGTTAVRASQGGMRGARGLPSAVLPIVQHFSLKSPTGQNWPLKRSGRAMLDRSIADEVEAAIRAGSAEKHLDTFKRVTDLFLASCDGYSG